MSNDTEIGGLRSQERGRGFGKKRCIIIDNHWALGGTLVTQIVGGIVEESECIV
jgi:hypothetical protein